MADEANDMIDTSDPNELVWVENSHPELNQGAWVPRSALRQLASQGWLLVEGGPAGEADTRPDGQQVAVQQGEMVAAGLDLNQLVAIRNDETGATAMVPLGAFHAQWQHAGWRFADEEQPPPNAVEPVTRDGQFDPAEVGYREVLDYLKTADDAERARVIAVESASAQPRKSITGWQPPAGDNTNKEGQS